MTFFALLTQILFFPIPTLKDVYQFTRIKNMIILFLIQSKNTYAKASTWQCKAHFYISIYTGNTCNFSAISQCYMAPKENKFEISLLSPTIVPKKGTVLTFYGQDFIDDSMSGPALKLIVRPNNNKKRDLFEPTTITLKMGILLLTNWTIGNDNVFLDTFFLLLLSRGDCKLIPQLTYIYIPVYTVVYFNSNLKCM